MSEIVNHGNSDPVELKTYVGKHGHVIVNFAPEKQGVGPYHFLQMTPYEAMNLAVDLQAAAKEIKDAL